MKKNLQQTIKTLDILLKKGGISQEQHTLALEQINTASFEGDGLDSKKKVHNEKGERALAYCLKIPCLKKPPPCQISEELREQIPSKFLKKHNLLPFKEDKNTLLCATNDLLNLEAIQEISLITQKLISIYYCPVKPLLKSIKDYLQQERQSAQGILSKIESKKTSKTNPKSFFDALDESDTPIVNLINAILSEANHQRASDIHFEPEEDELRIRYRIDGVLHKRHAPPKHTQSQLLTRLKVMAKLDIAQQRLPQDGRIKIRLGEKTIDLRISTLPTFNGERIVLRLLDHEANLSNLSQIGMYDPLLGQFQRFLKRKEGIILITGPTGSGKTSSLYASLTHLNHLENNIMTIEDPVEYQVPGISQMAVQENIQMSFSKGLKHILRQDPDVIMVGEIRDKQTASIAIQAALTGHLVLSSIHTNNAPSTIARLLDMDIESYLVSATLLCVLAQRLVRKICTYCKTSYKSQGKEETLLGIPKGEKLYFGKGCHNCYQSGYYGRQGIFELMPMTSKLQALISRTPQSDQLYQTSLEEGMLPLHQHGIALIKGGITTVHEVLRVTKELL